MPNIPDTDLDGLLKQAYEKYDMGRQTNSWESLSAVLDEHLPQKKDRRRGFFFLLFSFLVAGGAILFILSRSPHPTKTLAAKANQPATKANTELPAGDGPSAGGPATNGPATDRPVRDTSWTKAAGGHPQNQRSKPERLASPTERRPASPTERRPASPNERRPTQHTEQGPDRPTERRPTQHTERRQTQPTGTPDNPSPDAEPQSNPFSRLQSNPVSRTKPTPIAITLPTLAAITTPGFAPIAATPPLSGKNTSTPDSTRANAKKDKKPDRPKTRFFEAGILAGEDESNVKFKTGPRAGFNLGLLLGYSINKNWSVTSGVTYTQKNYLANGKDYHAPKDHFVNAPGVVLQKAASNCSMLDIPINVKYAWPAGNKSSFFVSTGISSYLMLKEAYTFYGTDTGVAFARGLEGDEVLKKGFWLSVLNLSLGYEKPISKRLSIQAEPYVKIPLQGIGFGKVLMSSYGINFAIKMKYFR